MDPTHEKILKAKLAQAEFDKLAALANPKLHRFIADAIELCKPSEVFVCTDNPEDIAHIRNLALELGEESPLAIQGHTIHYDGYRDQARDKERTKYLLPKGWDLGKRLSATDKEEGLKELDSIFSGIMEGKLMIVRFLCLGPAGSEFAISCVQITDSAYVAHSESLLYRSGYEQFKRIGDSPGFFRFLHSAGELDGAVSRNVDKRRIYIDLEDEIVYSTNTQYAGNTVGLKKLSFRLAIRRADADGWLAEHMFLMGAVGPAGRTTYFAGAFPSACGKTSTAMIRGQKIVGDDLAYLRKVGGGVRSVNVETGIFGIIQDVNSKDDPVIWQVLHEPGEVIFSNVLVTDGRPYWLGMGIDTPDKGTNHSGQWQKGAKDTNGNEITLAHKNARYTVHMKDLANTDAGLDDPEGVPLMGVIYGGRDGDTWVPVCEAFDWAHGVLTMGASLESKTTAATLGQEGVRKFNLMSILDFLSLPLGKYLQNHLDFVKGLADPPRIYGANYFLEDGKGNFLNSKLDKAVWLQWAERRVHGDVPAVRTPVGLIPRYEDLKKLFPEVLGEEYAEADYTKQFSIRVPGLLAKLDRVEKIYRADVPDTPETLYQVFQKQRDRLNEARQKFGSDTISPFEFPEEGA